MSLYVGHFGRTRYDKCSYPDRLEESTSPYRYIVDDNQQYNCRGCLTTLGPRSGLMGAGVSNMTGNVVAAAQEHIDVDSIMSNRNVPISKCKRGKVNPINVLRQIQTVDLAECNDYLDGENTRITDPAMFYRGAPINRFYDLNRDPQANIHWYGDFTNSRLEAKDNFEPSLPVPLTDWNYPESGDTDWVPCGIAIDANANCGRECEARCERKLRMSSNYANNTMNERKAKGLGTMAQ